MQKMCSQGALGSKMALHSEDFEQPYKNNHQSRIQANIGQNNFSFPTKCNSWQQTQSVEVFLQNGACSEAREQVKND